MDRFQIALKGSLLVQKKHHSHSDWLLEPAELLDLEHEIAAVDVLHDEVQAVL